MMSNRVDIALLCEDESHEQFIKKFLRRKHRSYRRVFPDGYKSGETGGVQPNNAFVLDRAVTEVAVARKVPPKRALILVIDGDARGFASRCGEIAANLKAANMFPLNSTECIALVVPCRNIETWIHHFAGEATDETQICSKRDTNASEAATAFAAWVSDGNAVEVVELPALNAARDELRRLHDLMK